MVSSAAAVVVPPAAGDAPGGTPTVPAAPPAPPPALPATPTAVALGACGQGPGPGTDAAGMPLITLTSPVTALTGETAVGRSSTVVQAPADSSEDPGSRPD
jgi:hypothetical protein